MVYSDKVNLPEAQTTLHFDRAFFLTYESLPRGVDIIITILIIWYYPGLGLSDLNWRTA